MYDRTKLLISILLTLAIVATACAAPAVGPTEPSPPVAADGAEPAAGDGEVVELRLVWWGSQERHNKTIEVIELFEQQHPNIDITYEFSGWTEYWPKRNTEAAAGNMPDIMQHDYMYLAEWVNRGLVLPLDAYVEQGILDLAEIAPNQLSDGLVDEKLYAINLGTNSQAFLADPALFEEAGVALPGPEWTWSDFIEIANTLHDELGIYAFEGSLYSSDILKHWLKQHGQWLYNEDGTELGYEDDQLFADFFQRVLDLQESGAIPSREFDAARGDMGVESRLIVTREAAMAWLWSNQIVAVSAAAGDRPLKMLLLPQIPDGIPGQYLQASMFFSITSGSEHPEEAAMFLDFFTNSVEANKILLAERGVPIAPHVREGIQSLLGPAQQEMLAFIDTVKDHSTPNEPPDPPGHSKIENNVYSPLVDEILFGQISPADAALRFRQEANAILAEQ